jgi:hypothetical protein
MTDNPDEWRHLNSDTTPEAGPQLTARARYYRQKVAGNERDCDEMLADGSLGYHQ